MSQRTRCDRARGKIKSLEVLKHFTILSLEVCSKKDLVKIKHYFGFLKRKLNDFTYATEVIVRNYIVDI